MIEIMYYVHGSTRDNETNIATGWDQAVLSPKGIEQTQKAALHINSRAYDAIFVSDMIRAIESAEILFSDRIEDIIIDCRLRECNYGTYAKRPSKELAFVEHIDLPFPCGESLRDVEIRMRRFLKDLESEKYRKIAVVSHRVPQLALKVITSNISWEKSIENDWRIYGQWQPGWCYVYNTENKN